MRDLITILPSRYFDLRFSFSLIFAVGLCQAFPNLTDCDLYHCWKSIFSAKISTINKERMAPFRQNTLEENMAEKDNKKVCFLCGISEDENVLLPCRKQGKDLWVCVRCLPPLIHGQH
ncbi:MAG: hypothetical protein AABY87_00975 [bacterium]